MGKATSTYEARQGNLFPFEHWSQCTPYIGWFYEVVAEKVFKAKRNPINNGKYSMTDHSVRDPDLFSIKNDELMIEVKSTQKSRDFKLEVKQWKNFNACSNAGFPYSYLWYAFFTHGVKDVVKNCMNVDELFIALTGNTLRCVAVDSLILANIMPTLRKYEAAFKWGEFYRVRQAWLTEVETNPFEVLESLALDPKAYKVDRVANTTATVLRRKLKSFPTTIVRCLNGGPKVSRKSELHTVLEDIKDAGAE